MFTYFKMKIREWKIKNAIYGVILDFVDNKKDIMVTAKNLFESMKDMTGDELRDEIIGKLAEVVYKNNQNKTEGE